MKLIHASFLACGLLVSACNAGSSAPAEHTAARAQVASATSSAPAAPSSAAYTPSQDAARAGLAASAASSPDVPVALLNHLQKGNSYAEFRKQTLANGWQPVASAMCMENVVGGNYKSLCAKHPDLSDCNLCQQMPELNTCSGDGYCTMQFRHTGTPEIMQITTYGDTNGWNGDRADGLMVTDWDFSKTPDK